MVALETPFAVISPAPLGMIAKSSYSPTVEERILQPADPYFPDELKLLVVSLWVQLSFVEV
jgi:hypothetical protein